MKNWYRKYTLEAYYEVGQWFKSGAWWLFPAAWMLVVAPPTFLLYGLFHTMIAVVFLPFYLSSQIRRMYNRRINLPVPQGDM